jgi:hypothetical protein
VACVQSTKGGCGLTTHCCENVASGFGKGPRGLNRSWTEGRSQTEVRYGFAIPDFCLAQQSRGDDLLGGFGPDTAIARAFTLTNVRNVA